MLNTNGIRLARDPQLAADLATLKLGFEVYLQFDSLTHFVEPNGKIYPFETWNLFYRDKVRLAEVHPVNNAEAR